MKITKYLPIIALSFVFVLITFFAIRSNTRSINDTGNLMLEEIVDDLYQGVDVPPYETLSLDKKNFEHYTFIPYNDKLSAVAADALVNITPHSMVVIHAENGDGAELAEDILEKADPNKWLCVGSETVKIAYTDHYVVLIMSELDTASAIVSNFKDMAYDLDHMDIKTISVNNPRYDI